MNTIKRLMNKSSIFYILLMVLFLSSCTKDEARAFAYGNFEAVETLISAEGNGKILRFDLEEGQSLSKGEEIGLIDSTMLFLKKEQLHNSKQIIASKSAGALSQISVLRAQEKTVKNDQGRISNMLKDGAATPKQLDDINGRLEVIRQQIRSVNIQNGSVEDEINNIDIQLRQLDEQIQDHRIINPVEGTVLVKYAEPNELTAMGKPLYKIANLNTMQLRVYVSETQLAQISLGQEIIVKIDRDDSMKEYSGRIAWIASEAEFTPKVIQTQEERVNLVYAVKLHVPNDGGLKIGMPGELWIDAPTKKSTTD